MFEVETEEWDPPVAEAAQVVPPCNCLAVVGQSLAAAEVVVQVSLAEKVEMEARAAM